MSNKMPPAPAVVATYPSWRPWWKILRGNIRNEFFYRVQALSKPLYKGMRWAYWDFDFGEKAMSHTLKVTTSVPRPLKVGQWRRRS